MLDGRVWRGHSGMAGEFGHTQVVPDGRECECGGRGCWEQYCSGNALVRYARAAAGHQAASLDELCGGEPAALTGPDGDHGRRCRRRRRAGGLRLGRRAGSASAWPTSSRPSTPRCVVVGGGVSAAGDQLLDPARAALAALARRRGAPAWCRRSLRARFGPEAGVVGGALLARDALDRAARSGRAGRAGRLRRAERSGRGYSRAPSSQGSSGGAAGGGPGRGSRRRTRRRGRSPAGRAGRGRSARRPAAPPGDAEDADPGDQPVAGRARRQRRVGRRRSGRGRRRRARLDRVRRPRPDAGLLRAAGGPGARPGGGAVVLELDAVAEVLDDGAPGLVVVVARTASAYGARHPAGRLPSPGRRRPRLLEDQRQRRGRGSPRGSCRAAARGDVGATRPGRVISGSERSSTTWSTRRAEVEQRGGDPRAGRRPGRARPRTSRPRRAAGCGRSRAR